MTSINLTENNILEYKREIPSDDRKWLKTVVAFANGKGGQIIFGIDDETHIVVGIDIENIARTVDRITDIILQNCTPQIIPDVRVDTMADKYVVVVDIKPGQNTPYYLTRQGVEEGTYVRVASSTRQAEPHIRMELMLRSKGMTYDQHIAFHQPPATEEEIRQLCVAVTRRNTKQIEVTGEHLISWGLLLPDANEQLLPSVTFCLLTRPDALHFSRIQCAVFLSNDRSHFLDSQELTGPIHEMADEAINYVLKNTRVEYRINGLYREELHEIPLPALREIIINSILHRNYLSPSFIQISIHPDRIEFFSPGTLHGSMTKERMLRGNCSSLRNPQLADILHRMNIVERWGSGIGRIFAACREQNLAIPEYDVDDMGVTVIIRRKHYGDKSQQSVHSVNKGKRTSATEEEVLTFISRHPGCTYSQLLQTFDISRRTLTNRLNSLMKQGKIQRSGSTRSANWSTL